MTEQERAAALADEIEEKGISWSAGGYRLSGKGVGLVVTALRFLAATPAAPSVVTDEMVGLTARNAALDEAAKVANDAGEAFRTRHQTAYAEGFTDACDAIYIACRALKVKEPTNDRP